MEALSADCEPVQVTSICIPPIFHHSSYILSTTCGGGVLPPAFSIANCFHSPHSLVSFPRSTLSSPAGGVLPPAFSITNCFHSPLSSFFFLLHPLLPNRWTYLIFVLFCTPTHFEAFENCTPKKCVNSRQKLPRDKTA